MGNVSYNRQAARPVFRICEPYPKDTKTDGRRQRLRIRRGQPQGERIGPALGCGSLGCPVRWLRSKGCGNIGPVLYAPRAPLPVPHTPRGCFFKWGGVPLTSPPGFFTRAKFSNPFGGRVSVRRPASRRWALTARRSCPFFDFRAFLAVREELGRRAPFVQNTAVSVALDGGRGTGGHL